MRRRRFLQLAGLAGVGAVGGGTAYTLARETEDPLQERLDALDEDGFVERYGAERGDERYSEAYDLFCDGVIDQRDKALYDHMTEDERNPLGGWARMTSARSVEEYRCGRDR